MVFEFSGAAYERGAKDKSLDKFRMVLNEQFIQTRFLLRAISAA